MGFSKRRVYKHRFVIAYTHGTVLFHKHILLLYYAYHCSLDNKLDVPNNSNWCSAGMFSSPFQRKLHRKSECLINRFLRLSDTNVPHESTDIKDDARIQPDTADMQSYCHDKKALGSGNLRRLDQAILSLRLRTNIVDTIAQPFSSTFYHEPLLGHVELQSLSPQ